MIRERAPAKLNLFLHILDLRDDGYHELESLVVFSEFGDELEFDVSQPKLSLGVSGPAIGGWTLPWETLDNSVMQAASALHARLPKKAPGVRINLTKNIPVAAGLGGGSSDAATTLRVLDGAWKTNLGEKELGRIALKLGADVPVCLRARATLMTGIGEDLHDAPPLPSLALVIAHTRLVLPTVDVFAELNETDWSGPSPLGAAKSEWKDAKALATFLKDTRNDLEAPAIRLQPQIAALLADLRANKACLLARMSGSGAACFGLYEKDSAATVAAAELEAKGWWAVATRLAP